MEQGPHAFLKRQFSYHEICILHMCLGFPRRILRMIRFPCRSKILSSNIANRKCSIPSFSYIDAVIPWILILIKAINFVLFTCSRTVKNWPISNPFMSREARSASVQSHSLNVHKKSTCVKIKG